MSLLTGRPLGGSSRLRGEERRRRLDDRPATEIEDAIADASEYPRLGLPVLDTSNRAVEEIVNGLASIIDSQ